MPCEPLSKNPKLLAWVKEIETLCQPDAVYWCDGSQTEYDTLCQGLVDAGTFIKLSDTKRPNSYFCRSDPADVARVEDRTYICSQNKEDAGPTNNWCDPTEIKTKLRALYAGCMKGARCMSSPIPWGPSVRPSPALA